MEPVVKPPNRIERRKQLQGEDYLFPSRNGGPIAQEGVAIAVYHHMPYCELKPERKRERLTVTRWAPHDLRRSVRTGLANLKCPAEIAEAIISHMQSGIRGVYDRHTYDAEKVEWLQKWDCKLSELMPSEQIKA